MAELTDGRYATPGLQGHDHALTEGMPHQQELLAIN
jgi:hypothetical protein